MKVCGRTGYQTRDLWLLIQTHYGLRYAARREIRHVCSQTDRLHIYNEPLPRNISNDDYI